MASHHDKRRHRLAWPLAAVAVTALSLGFTAQAMPVGNQNVPQPAKTVDLSLYLGTWYEYARYENRFEKDCEFVTAQYSRLDDGKVKVVNTCRRGDDTKVSQGKAIVQPDSGNAKLKVSFFGPFFFGDYWVLDHADDYSWSIVGEPSGKYLWLLTRQPTLAPEAAQRLTARATELGYDLSMLRLTQH